MCRCVHTYSWQSGTALATDVSLQYARGAVLNKVQLLKLGGAMCARGAVLNKVQLLKLGGAMRAQLTWSVRERLRRPAESRTTDRGMVTRAVATHRTMSTAEGGLLSCIGVPAPKPPCIKHKNSLFQPLRLTAASILTVETHVIRLQLFERMTRAKKPFRHM